MCVALVDLSTLSPAGIFFKRLDSPVSLQKSRHTQTDTCTRESEKRYPPSSLPVSSLSLLTFLPSFAEKEKSRIRNLRGTSYTHSSPGWERGGGGGACS